MASGSFSARRLRRSALSSFSSSATSSDVLNGFHGELTFITFGIAAIYGQWTFFAFASRQTVLIFYVFNRLCAGA